MERSGLNTRTEKGAGNKRECNPYGATHTVSLPLARLPTCARRLLCTFPREKFVAADTGNFIRASLSEIRRRAGIPHSSRIDKLLQNTRRDESAEERNVNVQQPFGY